MHVVHTWAATKRRLGVTDMRYSQGFTVASGRLATAPSMYLRDYVRDATIADCDVTAGGACMEGEKQSVA